MCVNCPTGIICLQVSTVLGAALPEQRKDNGWSEGVAIWIAVIIVSFVGEPRHLAILATPRESPSDFMQPNDYRQALCDCENVRICTHACHMFSMYVNKMAGM